MKKSLFLIAALAGVALVGCNKDINGPVIPEGRTAHVTLELLPNQATKATEEGTAAENQVNTVDALIFNADGTLDAYVQSTSYNATTKEAAEVDATTGAGKIIYAIVNAPASMNLSSVQTLAALEAKVFALTDNETSAHALTNFQMLGHTTADFAAGNNTVSFTVDRVVARVRIKKITRDFESAAMAAQDFSVTNIYMANVVGSHTLDGTYICGDSDLWYNKYTYDDGHTPKGYVAIDAAVNLWCNKQIASPVVIVDQASKDAEIASTFYVMPNNVVTDINGGTAWSARPTKIVIETVLAGKTYYYSIPIGDITYDPNTLERTYNAGILANHSYDIEELVITRPGSTNPDEPVEVADVTIKLTVNPWTVVPIQTETGKYVV